jgi:chromosome segregation ATPase
MRSKVIQTGVDALVELVKSEGTIFAKQASVRLGVSLPTINEWSSFLEEEGVIAVKYRFTVPYLSRKEVSDSEKKEIDVRLREERSIFRRKAESTLNYFRVLEEEIESLRKLLDSIGGKFQSRLKKVKDDLDKLNHLEEKKDKMDKVIEDNAQNYIQKLDLISSRLAKKRSAVEGFYKHIAKETEISKKFLDMDHEELEMIKNNERFLNERLTKIKSLITAESAKIAKTKDTAILEEKLRLQQLESTYLKLKGELDSDHKVLSEVIENSKDQQAELNDAHEEIRNKMKEEDIKLSKELNDLEGIPDKFKSYSEKKSSIATMLGKISYDEKLLKGKLLELIRRGRILDLDDSDEFKKDLEKLNKDLEDIREKKQHFGLDVKNLVKLIRK